MNMLKRQLLLLFTCGLLCGCWPAQAADQPNIVLVFMDNFGWGEPGFNGGGVIRGAPTPRRGACRTALPPQRSAPR